MVGEFLSKYIVQPVRNSYNYLTGKKGVSDDVQNTANQESSELLETDVQSSDVPPSSGDII